MAEPITLSALGAVALTEGIKFLYSQAGEILKRWRERQDTAKEASAQPNQTESVQVNLPPIFEGQLSAPKIHFDLVQRSEKELRALRKDLTDYAEGIETVDEKDENLLQTIDALRRLLETVYQQRLTFKGEQRSPSGPVVEGRIDVEEVLGYAAAVRAAKVKSGELKVDAKVKRVEPGGEFTGIDGLELG